MITKKDVNKIAKIIKVTREQWPGRMGGKGAPAGCLAERIADYLVTQVPHFNRSQFMEACGIR